MTSDRADEGRVKMNQVREAAGSECRGHLGKLMPSLFQPEALRQRARLTHCPE